MGEDCNGASYDVITSLSFDKRKLRSCIAGESDSSFIIQSLNAPRFICESYAIEAVVVFMPEVTLPVRICRGISRPKISPDRNSDPLTIKQNREV